MARLLERLVAIHAVVSKVSFFAAGIALVVFALAFNLEVVKRYFLNEPSSWAQDVISLAALAVTFLALPYVTLLQKHVTIDIAVEKLGITWRRWLQKFQVVASLTVLLLIAVIALLETIKVYELGVATESAIAIPKWPALAVMTWGFFSAAMHLLAILFDLVDTK